MAHSEVAGLLPETLDEEKSADSKLSMLARDDINMQEVLGTSGGADGVSIAAVSLTLADQAIIVTERECMVKYVLALFLGVRYAVSGLVVICLVSQVACGS